MPCLGSSFHLKILNLQILLLSRSCPSLFHPDSTASFFEGLRLSHLYQEIQSLFMNTLKSFSGYALQFIIALVFQSLLYSKTIISIIKVCLLPKLHLTYFQLYNLLLSDIHTYAMYGLVLILSACSMLTSSTAWWLRVQPLGPGCVTSQVISHLLAIYVE